VDAFDRLHPTIQQWIWQQGWQGLRDVQEQAIAPVLEAESDLIIAAATAEGKTEAAFLPIFSKLMETGFENGFAVLAISPLKALINDQYDRLSHLGEILEIPVCPWHGDIDSGRKQQARSVPKGIVIITPEALEAMLINHGHDVLRLFSALQYIVIDELHVFIGSERGQQLRSIMHRIEQAIGKTIPRIGLSATLGDMSLAQAYLRPEAPENVQMIISEAAGREVKLQVRGYRKVIPGIFELPQMSLSQDACGDEIAIAEHLFKTLRGQKNLIFVNRRQDVEQYADRLNSLCIDKRVPKEFFPHHGSLSKDLRLAAEEALQERNRPANVLCTSTLELGIDIGAVNSIAQIGVPFSVASLRQRLGRSGRGAGDPSVLRMYVMEPEINPMISPEEMLRPSLVQSIATVNLLLQGWYEPPVLKRLHLSTLVQQVLSSIAQWGGISPNDCWRLLCESGVFPGVDERTFIHILRCLGQLEMVVQGADGLLLLGLKGERLVGHYSFFTAFNTPEEYQIVNEGKLLGTLPIEYPLVEDRFMIFAGKRWQIKKVRQAERIIEVEKATAGQVPSFGGGAGIVHDRIRQEMLKVYQSDVVPAFLDKTAKDLLQEGRNAFYHYELDRRSMLQNGDRLLLFPWSGTVVMNTLSVQLAELGYAVDQGAIALTVEAATIPGLRQKIQPLLNNPPDPVVLAEVVANKEQDKYDRFLSQSLLCLNYASSQLNIDRAWPVLRELIG
jgi:ATP-dependent helicase Lhr and Lhr-like helicase